MNLKLFLDTAVKAEARVQQIAAQIDQLFEAGDTAKALELKPQLDTARADAKAANEMYVSMRDVASSGESPEKFTRVDGGVQVVTDEADRPFASKGEFFMAVKNVALYPGREDPRLRSLKVKEEARVRNATGMSEGIPAEGGYLVKPEYADGWIERMYTIGELLSRVAKDPVTGNSMTYNTVDETSRVDGSQYGGVTGYWLGEGGTITGSKPKFSQLELKLKKVAALCYATDEQLQDTANLESWLNRTVPNVLRFMAEDAVYDGDGVGKPLGILNSPCLISVLRQDANKVQFADIVTMWSRRWAGVSDYIWLINQDVSPQLDQLALTAYSSDVSPRFVDYGPDGVMRMKGKPVFEVEYAQSMGTKGDIMLASMSQYQTITKGDVQSASSMHVAFVTDEQAFRFILRIDGEPMWASALTPHHGSNTLSPFVVLATASV